MEIVKFVFFLGIVYIVFSIIWFLLATIPKMLFKQTSSKNIESYILKTLQYYFIGSLTSLASKNFIENNIKAESGPLYIVTGGVVLFLYLAGKMERNKMLFKFKSVITKNFSTTILKYEPHLIGFTMVLYALSIGVPNLVNNPINSWFLESIHNFYDTPIIGWIIGFAGVFFLMTIVFRGVNAVKKILLHINSLVTGKPVEQKKSSTIFDQFKNMTDENNPMHTKQEQIDIDDDIYVDFEEIEDDKDS